MLYFYPESQGVAAVVGVRSSCCIIMRVDGSPACFILIDSFRRYVNVCSHCALILSTINSFCRNSGFFFYDLSINGYTEIFNSSCLELDFFALWDSSAALVRVQNFIIPSCVD